ncbi:hypothetical protein GH975_06295 [Litorivicinus lipolyticus]|uniref:FlgN protein n=2 Tax=Litorivicinus lipolyticus TaxID=418701 RepID=A0A5Q2QGR6_9GAMM|nr:flagellar export chaperone FlgN [Litorivicinus lipolyticus]QGG80205.1 hypothetical protein GH975_06295 [Litorivicinus lipolyticus]
MNAAVQRYLALLGEMTRSAQSLEKILLIERDDMAAQSAASVKTNLTEKVQALKTLETNIELRRELLTDAGLTPDADGHRQLLGSLTAELAEQLERGAADAEAAIERCQNLNQGNAQVLQRLKQKADAIKTVISGGEGQRLYGAKGKTSASGGGRALGEA